MTYRRHPSTCSWRHPRLLVASLVALGVLAVLATRAGAAGSERRASPERLLTSSTLVVNEIDVDQPGTDTAEFVELLNVSASSIDLDPYSIELVNGDLGGAVVYRTIDLPSTSLAPGDYYVVCGLAGNVPNCDLELGFASNIIQNGAPDAVAVVKGTTVEDTVSYEGDTGSPYTEGTGSGLEDDGSEVGQTLSRYPDGTDTDQNSQDLSLHCASPGAANLLAEDQCSPATDTPTASATNTPTPTTSGVDLPTATAAEVTATVPPTAGTPQSPTPTATATATNADPPTETRAPSTATVTPTTSDPAATTTPTPTPEYLAVQLVAMNAERVGRAVYVRWRTTSEVDNAGFHLWRGQAGPLRVRLTGALLPARGSGLSGASYTFRDAGAPTGRARYWVEDVDTSGQSTFHGPVTAPAWQPPRKIPPLFPFPVEPLRQPAMEVAQ